MTVKITRKKRKPYTRVIRNSAGDLVEVEHTRKSLINWSEAFEDWCASQMAAEGKPLRLLDIAEKYGVKYPTVMNKSHKDKWAEKLKIRIHQRDEFMTIKMKEHQAEVVKAVQVGLMQTEVEVRAKHAKAARMLQHKAITRLSGINLEEISPRDALMMLRVGLEEERKALGLPDIFVKTEGDNVQHPEYKPLVQQFENHRNVQALGLQLLRELRKRSKDFSEATILQQVGINEVSRTREEMDNSLDDQSGEPDPL